MKTYLLAMTLLVVFMSACTFNVGAPANSANAPSANSTANAANTTNNAAPSNVKSGNQETGSVGTGTVAPTGDATESSGGEVVEIPAGENSAALIERKIPANGSLDFLINAKKGQKIGIQMGYEGRASDIKGFLSEPGLQDEALSLGPETRKEFAVKTAGDHRLTVVNNTGKQVTFSLYVDIF